METHCLDALDGYVWMTEREVNMSIDALLEPYPVQVRFPVHWGEMDSFQHVNNAVYFRYFESARIEYFKKMGIVDQDGPAGIGPILAATSCKFIYPLSFPDEVVATARVIEVGEDRFQMGYGVFSVLHARIAAIGEGVIVPYDYSNGRKASLPRGWASSIEDIEERRI
jgi:acyl-CoA thioester hydrolase